MTSLHWVEFRFLAPTPPPATAAEPVESRCSAISSAMKVFRSTSWRPLRLPPRHTGPAPPPAPPPPPPPLPWVGELGGPERTLILAMAPLRPGGDGGGVVSELNTGSSRPVTQQEPYGPERFGSTTVRGLLLPCSAIASLNGWRSVSTEEPVSGEGLARLGASTASRGLVRLLLGGGALPQRKLIKSSRRMVLRRFFTHAKTSCEQIKASISRSLPARLTVI